MGTFGAVVIYLDTHLGVGDPALAATKAAAILEQVSLLQPGTADTLQPDADQTFTTCEILEDPEEPVDSSLRWSHIAIDPATLAPAIQQLVYASTEEEFWEKSEPARVGKLAVPFVDITAFSKPITITADEGEVHTPLLVEFTYEDARLDYANIHRIRDDYHPVFNALSQSFGCATAWTIVAG